MAQKFKETAHLHTDMEKYGANYDRIFKTKSSSSVEPDSVRESSEVEESLRIKNLARELYREHSGGQDTEGFPESSSFIFGFVKGYQASREGR